jgi:hypothetical protein
MWLTLKFESEILWWDSRLEWGESNSCQRQSFSSGLVCLILEHSLNREDWEYIASLFLHLSVEIPFSPLRSDWLVFLAPTLFLYLSCVSALSKDLLSLSLMRCPNHAWRRQGFRWRFLGTSSGGLFFFPKNLEISSSASNDSIKFASHSGWVCPPSLTLRDRPTDKCYIEDSEFLWHRRCRRSFDELLPDWTKFLTLWEVLVFLHQREYVSWRMCLLCNPECCPAGNYYLNK